MYLGLPSCKCEKLWPVDQLQILRVDMQVHIGTAEYSQAGPSTIEQGVGRARVCAGDQYNGDECGAMCFILLPMGCANRNC